MDKQYGTAQATYVGGIVGGLAAFQTGPQVSPPPQPTRFSSCAGRMESQVNHLFACVERASRVADRLGGAIPQEVGGLNKAAPSCSNVAAIIEEQNERLDIALKSLMNALERLEQL